MGYYGYGYETVSVIGGRGGRYLFHEELGLRSEGSPDGDVKEGGTLVSSCDIAQLSFEHFHLICIARALMGS